jgi:hypothetical protein
MIRFNRIGSWSSFSFEHDPLRKPVPTPDQVRGRLFRDHALASRTRGSRTPCGTCDRELWVQRDTRFTKLLVPLDSEVRTRPCRKHRRTSESGTRAATAADTTRIAKLRAPTQQYAGRSDPVRRARRGRPAPRQDEYPDTAQQSRRIATTSTRPTPGRHAGGCGHPQQTQKTRSGNLLVVFQSIATTDLGCEPVFFRLGPAGGAFCRRAPGPDWTALGTHPGALRMVSDALTKPL